MKRNLLFAAAFALILISFIIYKKTGDENFFKKNTNKAIHRVTNKQMNAMKFLTPYASEGMLVRKITHNAEVYYFNNGKWKRLSVLWHR